MHDTELLFQAMFTDVPRKGGVSHTVNRLWAPAKGAPQAPGQPASTHCAHHLYL
ncbi:MAG: hypothetical protein P8Y71_12315 [Pseudolabrys sp.]